MIWKTKTTKSKISHSAFALIKNTTELIMKIKTIELEYSISSKKHILGIK